MGHLTAHIVYATFKALDAEEKEAFVRLIEEDKKRYGRKNPKKENIHDKLPAKYHPDNFEMLVAEWMHS